MLQAGRAAPMMLRTTLSKFSVIQGVHFLQAGQGIVVRCAEDSAAIPNISIRGKGDVRRRRGLFRREGGEETGLSGLRRRT